METTYRALLITNSEFPQDTSDRLKPLNGAPHDADTLKAALVHDEYGLFDEENLIVCSDKPLQQVKRDINAFIDKAHPDDTLLIYYSGHGQRDDGQLYLCVNDTDGAELSVNGLDTEFIRHRIISRNRAQRVIIVLDCCYAGGYEDDVSKGAPEMLSPPSFAEGQYVLLSSGPYETSKDAEQRDRPSPFTEALAEALVDPSLPGRQEGILTIQEVYNRLFERYQHRELVVRPQKSDKGAGAIPIARRGGILVPLTLSGQPHKPVSFEATRLVIGGPQSEMGAVAEAQSRVARLGLSPAGAIRPETVDVMLDLIDKISERATQSEADEELAKRAWRELGRMLRRCLADDGSLGEVLATPLSADAALKLEIAFDQPHLADLPWELLYLDHGPAEGQASEFLGLYEGCLISRVSRASGIEAPRPQSGSITVLFASSYDDITVVSEAERQLVSDVEAVLNGFRDATSGRSLGMISLRGKCSWTQFASALRGSVQVVYLFVPVRHIDNQLKVAFTIGDRRDWVDATSVVAELTRAHKSFECLLIETVASSPEGSTYEATRELAARLAETGRGPVVAVCHCPQYAALRTPDQRPHLTFGGRFFTALRQNLGVDQALYTARTELVQPLHSGRSIFFGAPLLYEPRRAEPRSASRTTQLPPRVRRE